MSTKNTLKKIRSYNFLQSKTNLQLANLLSHIINKQYRYNSLFINNISKATKDKTGKITTKKPKESHGIAK